MKAAATSNRVRGARAHQAPGARRAWRTRDSHEHQAEASAARFGRGERQLGRDLTAAPVSSLKVPGSLPAAVPGALISELEAAFGANLCGLRFHTDAPAQDAARRLGARAFAAGPAIYLGPDAWSPASPRGRRLLAHEVAHVLQQTGRAAAGGRLRLEPTASGEAGVQRDPDPNDVVREAHDKLTGGYTIQERFSTLNLLKPATGTAACLTVLDRHLALPADDLVTKWAAQIKTAVDGKTTEAATNGVDAVLAKVPDADKSDRVKMLFFDCYKALGSDKNAVDLIGKTFPETTAFGTWSFYADKRQGDAAWVMPLLRKHPVASKYVDNIVAVARIDFYGMGRGGLDLDPEMKFNAHMADAIVDALLYQPVMPDERTAVALRALCVFNTIRLGPFEDFSEQIKGKKSLISRFVYKKALISDYTDPDMLTKRARAAGAEPEVLQITADAGRRVAPIATRAVAYWDKIAEASKATLGVDKGVAAEAQSTQLQDQIHKRLPGIKGLGGVDKQLIGALQRATQLERGGLPEPTTLAANLSSAAGAVEQITFRIDGALAAREKTLQIKDIPKPAANDTDVAAEPAPVEMTDDMIYGVVLFTLFALQSILVEYVAPPKAKGDALIAVRDAAAAKYKQIAQRFANVAVLLGYQDLLKAAVAARDAEQAGVLKSYIGLLAPFEKVPATLKDFSRDFPKGGFAGGAITGEAFIQAVYALYYDNFLGKLTDALNAQVGTSTREFTYTAGQEPIVNTALKAVEATQGLPKKYRVPGDSTVLFIRVADSNRMAEVLNHDHPHVQALIKDFVGQNEAGLVPENYLAHTEGFVIWVLPDIDKLAEKVAAVPLLADLKTKDGKPLADPKKFARPRDWLSALGQVAGDDQALKDAIAAAVRKWLTDSHQALDAPLRRATNNERRIVRPLIAEQWERLTKSFLKDPKAYYDAPRAALRYTLTFAGNIAPATAEEQRLQMAGLMLELAPVLIRKLGESTSFGDLVRVSGTDRLDIVLPLYSNVKGAAELGMKAGMDAEFATLHLDFDKADLARRARQLSTLAEEFRATAEEWQAQTKLEGSVAENSLRVPNRAHPLIGKINPTDEVDDMMRVEGVVYQLVKVHRNFAYQPELMTAPGAIPWAEENIGNRQLSVDGEPVKVGAKPIDLMTIMRTPDGGDPSTIVVNSDNVKMLSEVTYALHMHIVMEDLEALAGVLEEGAGWLTAAIQIAFPEFAAEIAYAEIAGSILQFLGSPEYAMIKAAFGSDSGTTFSQHLTKLKDELSLETLWTWFFFDQLPPELDAIRKAAQLVGRLGMLRNKGHRDDEKTTSSKSKVFSRIEGIGEKVVHGAMSMQEHVNFPVRKLELFVEASPLLAILLRIVARNLHRLAGMDIKEFGLDEAADMVGEVQQMYRRFENVIDGLAEYELPEVLVPLETILDMVVQMVIDRLPTKYRIPLKLAERAGIDKILAWILGKVANALRDANLDPNILWQRYARDAINPYLKSAATTVSTEVHGLLTKVPFLEKMASMDAREVGVRFLGGEAQPKLAAGGPASLPAPSLPAGPSANLGSAERASAQRGWGHDFSHVRVHRGMAVDASLHRSGAMAATSGSHVYLDSKVRTDGPAGSDVLNHELAHVLQQGGPRPLGQRHSSQPTQPAAGSTASSWRVEPGAEAQADRLAVSARNPARAPRSVSRSHGVQPKFADVVVKFFNKLGDPSALKGHAEKMVGNTVDAKSVEQAAPQLKGELFANKLIEALKTWKEPGSVVGFASPFDAAKSDVIEYLLSNRGKDLKDKLPHVLMSVLHKVEVKKDGKTEDVWILIPNRLETALEEFFFGITGISMDVEFKFKKQASPDGKQRDTVDADTPFSKLKFNYIHFPMLGGGAKIWDNIVQNSFPKAGDKKALYQTKARLALAGLQPRPGLFTTATQAGAKVLVFSRKSKELIETYVHPPPSRDLPGDAVPKWLDYVNPKGQARAKIGNTDYGQVGLRVGFYKDKDNPDQQKGTDRASHHTVQYLLLEYLVNSKDRHKPFPHSLSLYPNVRATGGRVEIISREPGGTSGIKVAANESGRGGTMPTILLSVHAHTFGDVHVSTKPDDLDTEAPSQGSAIHGIYRDALGDHAKLVFDKAKLEALDNKSRQKPYDATKLAVGGQEATPESLSTAIFDAACKTYTWMREHMNDKLMAAIDSREVEYYEALVQTAKNTEIFDKDAPKPGYVTSKVGADIKAAVLEKQAEIFHSASFGFQEKT
jgi:hypothetical protein